MSHFIALNPPEYIPEAEIFNLNPEYNFCVCCLKENASFIYLNRCKHAEFLNYFFKYKTEFPNSLVCLHCHGILRKIDRFRLLVQESIIKLEKQVLQQECKTKSEYLKSDTVVNIEFNPFSNANVEENTEWKDIFVVEGTKNGILEDKSTNFTNNLTGNNIHLDESSIKDVNVKSESDSDLETDLPLSEVKQKKRQNGAKRICVKKKIKKENNESPYLNEGYVGKLTMLTLTREELVIERDKMRKEESYLRLPYKCDNCIVGYNKEESLKKHLKERHFKKENSSAMVCDVCKSIFNDKRSYVPHHKRHFIRYECNICEKRYIDERAVLSHYNEKHGAEGATVNNKFKCNIQQCQFSTHSYRSFIYHRSKHENYPCEKCDKVYDKWIQLRSHMYQVHSKPRSYACTLCTAVYRQRCGLRLHTQAVHSAARHHCAQCRKVFTTDNNLRKHLHSHSRHADLHSNKFMCDNCGAKFPTKSRLKGHIEWVHLKKSKYQCDICLKMVRTSRSLKNHIAYVHEKKKVPRDHICDYCGKAFTRRSLKSHMDTHTGARPHRCAHCGAAFTHAATLYNHRKLLHSDPHNAGRC